MQNTWSALLGLFHGAARPLASLQLLPGSPFLRELAETPLPAGDVVSVGALRDWLAPVASTVLGGVTTSPVYSRPLELLVGGSP